MKKLFAVLLAVLMVASALAGCGKEPSGGNLSKEYAGEMVEGGNTYADASWLPVVKEPITLTAIINDNLTVGDYNARTLWAEIAEKTGVNIELRLLTDIGGESEKLLFAGRDYPDFSFRLHSAALVHEACINGDIIELNEELLSTYAPNWYGILAENDEINRLTLHSDGKRYSLPQIIMEESAVGMRDLQVINADWLDELGMAIPETLDAFTDYLRAVKNAAGTGSIPSNVVPLYLRHYTNIGSWYTICDWFGVYQGLNGEIVLNDKTVVSNAQDEALKAPIKYVNGLYTEGLIDQNFNADPTIYANYLEAIGNDQNSTVPWFVGAHFSYGLTRDFLTCFPPLKVSEEIDPVIRDMGLEARIIKDAFFIFVTNKTPIATLRTIDAYATPEGAVRSVIGTAGENSTYIITEDGKYLYNPNKELVVADSEKGWNDYGPGIVPVDIAMQLNAESIKDPQNRLYWYYNMYRDYRPADKQLFPQAALAYLSDAENAELNNITPMITSNIKTFILRWIKGQGDIDAEWDGFQQKLIDLGLKRKLELYQKAWDLYSEAAR